MGTRFSIVHDFDCDPATYWDIFWDEAFNADQYARMRCGRTVLAQHDQADRRVRDQEIRPQRDVPAILRKLIPQGALKYVEHGVWKQPAGPLEVDIKVPAAGARFAMTAFYSVADLAARGCRREFAGECTIRIPLVAGMAEKAVIDSMRETYETAAKVHREWIARRKPSV